MTERVGFAGIGLMGRGMAKNILAAGYPLAVVAHRNRAPIEELVQRGATELQSYRQLAADSDLVLICVTGTPEVESVVYEPGGLLEGAHEGLIAVDCSTSEPSSSARIATALAEQGASFIDAPLARTPVEAEAGRLNAMVGAAHADFARVRPVLEACCENIFHMGPPGSGHKTKLVYNFITMGYAALISEALCACAATEVDLKRFAEVVSAGGANSGIFQLIAPKSDRARRLLGPQLQPGKRREGSALLQPHGGHGPVVRNSRTGGPARTHTRAQPRLRGRSRRRSAARAGKAQRNRDSEPGTVGTSVERQRTRSGMSRKPSNS